MYHWTLARSLAYAFSTENRCINQVPITLNKIREAGPNYLEMRKKCRVPVVSLSTSFIGYTHSVEILRHFIFSRIASALSAKVTWRYMTRPHPYARTHTLWLYGRVRSSGLQGPNGETSRDTLMSTEVIAANDLCNETVKFVTDLAN